MEADEKSIDLFTTRVRQMILQYNDLEQQNVALNASMAEQKARISQLETQLARLQSDYDNLKVVRMLAITDGDMASAQKRLARLIRNVDKCITLVSGHKENEEE